MSSLATRIQTGAMILIAVDQFRVMSFYSEILSFHGVVNNNRLLLRQLPKANTCPDHTALAKDSGSAGC